MKKYIIIIVLVVVVGVGFFVFSKSKSKNVIGVPPLPDSIVIKNSENKNMTNQKQEDLLAILNTDAYGYNITVLVNGHDIGLKGNSSGGARLFNKEHSKYKNSTPDVLITNGILVEGKNNFVIKYSKVDPTSQDKLHLDLKMQGYTEPLFTVDAKDNTGTIQQSIDIQPTPAADFKPIIIER